jgi:Tol biopolymer transport system component
VQKFPGRMIVLLLVVSCASTEPRQAYQVSEGTFNSILHYFNVSPESPDGRWVVYSRFQDVPLRSGGPAPAKLVLYDRDLDVHRIISATYLVDAHAGLAPIWLDNETVAYSTPEDQSTHILSIRTGDEQVYTGGRIHSYSPQTGKLLMTPTGAGELAKGLYTMDRNGATDKLFDMSDIEPFTPFGERQQFPFELSDGWSFGHPYWSPDGRQVAFCITLHDGDWKIVFIADADGDNLRSWRTDVKKPMHWHWFDNESLVGHDDMLEKDKLMRRWDLSGNTLGTVAGYGCHGDVSPDGRWVATEDWYNSDPVRLYLYPVGSTVATDTLVVQQEHWDHSHMHPAFSFNSERVYFNYNVPGDNTVRLYCVDMDAYR